MKFKFKIQQYQTDVVGIIIASLSNLESLPYENA